MKKTCITRLVLLAALTLSTNAWPQTTIVGQVTITAQSSASSPKGLFIQSSGGVPDHCGESKYKWMFIADEDRSIQAIALLAITQNRLVTIYTQAPSQGEGLCRVTQIQMF